MTFACCCSVSVKKSGTFEWLVNSRASASCRYHRCRSPRNARSSRSRARHLFFAEDKRVIYFDRGVTDDVILCVSLNVPPIRKGDAIPHLVALPFVVTPDQRGRLRHVEQERTLIEGNFRVILSLRSLAWAIQFLPTI